MTTNKHPKLHHTTTAITNHAPPPPPPLIPGLPDHVAHLCLIKLPPTLVFSVCSTWRRLIGSSHYPPYRSLYALLSPLSQQTTAVRFSSFDPISHRWISPPQPPLPILSRHPSFISRNLPIASLTVSSHVTIVAATSSHLLPALPQPLLFNPLTSTWTLGPHLHVPRRWCAAASLGTSVYVASGVGSHFCSDTARSVHKWDITQSRWDPATPLQNVRFSREAVDAVGWRGRLCVVHVAAKEGAVYDPEHDTWSEISRGMVEGWRGPVAALDEDKIFCVDECKGVLRRYEEEGDCWVDVVDDVRFRGALQMAAGGGKVCVVSGSGGIIVVDVTAEIGRTWVVEPPPGFKTVAVHVLPRMPFIDDIN